MCKTLVPYVSKCSFPKEKKLVKVFKISGNHESCKFEEVTGEPTIKTIDSEIGPVMEWDELPSVEEEKIYSDQETVFKISGKHVECTFEEVTGEQETVEIDTTSDQEEVGNYNLSYSNYPYDYTRSSERVYYSDSSIDRV